MKRGVSPINKPMILVFTVFFMALVAVGVWVHNNGGGGLTAEETAPDGLNQKGVPSTAGQPYGTPVEPDPSDPQENAGLWNTIHGAFQVERVHHSGDEKRLEWSGARKDLSRAKRLVKELRGQGLEGDALYSAAADLLVERYGPGVLKMLDGYRLLEQELDQADLDSLSPEERSEYTCQARRNAFGEYMADLLFFTDEARGRHRLQERALLADSGLSEEARQEKIIALRRELRVALASRGSSISFPDERRQRREERLRARYGDSVETMSPEERDKAMWDIYSEELPPDVYEKLAGFQRDFQERVAARHGTDPKDVRISAPISGAGTQKGGGNKMTHKRLGLLVIFALVLGVGVGARADTVCDEPGVKYADYTSGVSMEDVDLIADTFKRIPINLDNTPIELPPPPGSYFEQMFPPGLLGLIWGSHTIPFTLNTAADLDGGEYSLDVGPGRTEIELYLDNPIGPYLQAHVAFGDVTHDCTENPLLCLLQVPFFDMLDWGSLDFSIDRIWVTQEFDTCILNENCERAFPVESTVVTLDGFDLEIDGGVFEFFIEWMLELLAPFIIDDFIVMAFEPLEGETSLVMMKPFLMTADGCRPPDEYIACMTGGGCSTALQEEATGQGTNRTTSAMLYMLPGVVLFGLLIWRRKR